jgi:nicotinamidase/pyrazinamidase
MVRTVFFDVDTQLDFLYPAGALYVPGAETIVARVAALNHFAGEQGLIVISTTDAHQEDDPEFHDWPPHCIAGTSGQRKPASTLLDRRIAVPNTPALPEIGHAQQILLGKQALDCFTNVNLTPILTLLGAERYVVYGVVTEICVRFAAFGLLKTGRRVELVTDAVKELDTSAQTRMFEDFTAKGGVLTTAAQVMSEVYH